MCSKVSVLRDFPENCGSIDLPTFSESREWGGFQPKLFLYLFDHKIMPILNYASEEWGTNDFTKQESLHLSAC